MADFINFEATQVDENDDVIMVSDDDSQENEVCDNNFIDHSAALDEVDASFYRVTDMKREQQSTELQNVGNVDGILAEELEQSFNDMEDMDIQNLCDTDEEIEPEVMFASAEKRLKVFKETFFPLDKESLSFKEAILYAIRYEETKIIDTATTTEFNSDIANKIENDLLIELDLRKFNNMCMELTETLMQHNYFLKIFKLRNKFREVRLKTTTDKKLLRELSRCIKIKFDGFEIVIVQCRRDLRRKFTPIDVIYKPVLRKTDPIHCFVSSDIAKSYYSVSCYRGEINRTGYAYTCYYCQKFFVLQDRFKKHIESCTGVPGIVYNFQTQNLVTFEDNLKNKGDLPMTFYFDLETTTPTDSCYDPEQK